MRKLLLTIAGPLSLLALAIIAHVAMHTPTIKPYVERAPISPKRYTVCGIAGAENCWEVVGVPMR